MVNLSGEHPAELSQHGSESGRSSLRRNVVHTVKDNGREAFQLIFLGRSSLCNFPRRSFGVLFRGRSGLHLCLRHRFLVFGVDSSASSLGLSPASMDSSVSSRIPRPPSADSHSVFCCGSFCLLMRTPHCLELQAFIQTSGISSAGTDLSYFAAFDTVDGHSRQILQISVSHIKSASEHAVF